LSKNVEIPGTGDVSIVLSEAEILVPPLHPKFSKFLVYFEGNIVEEALGRNIDFLYSSTRKIPVTDINKAVPECKVKELDLGVHLIALPQPSRLLYWDYTHPSFRRLYKTIYYSEANGINLFHANYP
jgi:hypothetical protein